MMQIHREYDKLVIPEKYAKMSAAQLRMEKERAFANLTPVSPRPEKSVIETKTRTITFKF